MAHPIVIIKDGFFLLSWEIENYEAGSSVGLVVDKDPGDGVVCFAPAADSHTKADGTGSYLGRMRNLGEFEFTLTIKPKSGGDAVVKSTHVSVQTDPKILTFKSLTADKTEVETGEDVTLKWEIDNYNGSTTMVKAVYPDIGQVLAKATTADDGTGTLTDTERKEAVGDVTYQLFDLDPEAPDIKFWVQHSNIVTVKVIKASDWQAVLPSRTGKSDNAQYANLVRPANAAPSINYVDANKVETPAQDTTASADDIKRALQKVKDARARIPKRPFHLDFVAKKGNLYMPDGQFDGKKLAGIDASPEFAAYKASTVLPTHCDSTAKDFDATLNKVWEYFKTLWPAEGLISTVTAAAVDVHVTIGAGFASSGKLAQKLFKKLLSMPDTHLAERAIAAGLRVDVIGGKHEFVVVDTTKECILTGLDAANYVCTNLELLSFIANAGIGAQGDIRKGTGPVVESDAKTSEAQIRGMLDVQLGAFGDSAAPTADFASWPLPPEERFSLIAHARHGGDFAGWKGGLADADPPAASTAAVAENVWARLKKKVGAPGKSTGPLTAIRKARAICAHWPAAMSVIKKHATSETDGYDFDKDKPVAEGTPVTWKSGSEP